MRGRFPVSDDSPDIPGLLEQLEVPSDDPMLAALPETVTVGGPACPRCFMLAGVRRTGQHTFELWCGFCCTIAIPRWRPRGESWEARGNEAHLGVAHVYDLHSLTPRRLWEANERARERLAAWHAKQLEMRRKAQQPLTRTVGRVT